MCCFSRSPAWLLGALAVIVGCGEKPVPVELGLVSGTVTLGGMPLAKAFVAFTPSINGGRTSIGVTDASGRYTLAYTQDTNGANIGRHEVHISTAAFDVNAKERVPEKYVRENPLSAEVRSGDNVIDFAL
jgi:hypothetical protein